MRGFYFSTSSRLLEGTDLRGLLFVRSTLRLNRITNLTFPRHFFVQPTNQMSRRRRRRSHRRFQFESFSRKAVRPQSAILRHHATDHRQISKLNLGEGCMCNIKNISASVDNPLSKFSETHVHFLQMKSTARCSLAKPVVAAHRDVNVSNVTNRRASCYPPSLVKLPGKPKPVAVRSTRAINVIVPLHDDDESLRTTRFINRIVTLGRSHDYSQVLP